MKRVALILGLLSVLLGATPQALLAAPAISKSQAASIAATQYPGKVINISLSDDDPTTPPVYRVKILDNKGGMHIVTINGNNGNIITAH